MKRIVSIIFGLIAFTYISSCASYNTKYYPPSATANGPRKIVLEGDTISSHEFGGFTSWYCKDYVYDDKVVVEVGFYNDPSIKGLGFILFDGGFTGVEAT